jgi:hypothetical protein
MILTYYWSGNRKQYVVGGVVEVNILEVLRPTKRLLGNFYHRS